MFLGHQGLALAAKRLAPKTSFGTLWLSTEFIDVLWPLFLLLGIEHVRIDPGNTRMTPMDFYAYPFSHVLLSDSARALAFRLISFPLRQSKTASLLSPIDVHTH